MPAMGVEAMKWLFRTGTRRERRRAERYPVNVPVQVKQGHLAVGGVMVNLSKSGAAVELFTEEPLKGEIAIHLRVRGAPIVLLGRVVHSHATEMDGCLRHGIAFVGDPQQNERYAMDILTEYQKG